MMSDKSGASNERKPHAILDLESRRAKGLKIERLLNLGSRTDRIRMLEIGAGSGGISHYFATHPLLDVDVEAIDVVDNRKVADGYRFQLVNGTSLPFADQQFDVVLTNHVIEHVGDRTAQLHHLKEIHRVMRGDAVGYLAVPNRWRVVEPHYKLAFLSWLPRSLRSGYLRMRKGGDFYDCEPLAVRELEALLRETEFRYDNLCVPSVRATVDIELSGTLAGRAVTAMPDGLISAFRGLIPTLIFRFERI
jgi:SAM-dependent methyltransferase